MAAAAEVPFDVIEQILVRLDVEDLLRFKSVCKSWYYSISSPPFVKAHLKHSYNIDCNDPELGHRRIVLDFGLHGRKYGHRIVGSCNGLVCSSPTNAELVVTNPSTGEHKELKIPPFRCEIGMIRDVICWGFGYAADADDYKVIAGFRETFDKKQTLFYVLTLKSNMWKVIGEVKYRCFAGVDGILCGGALYWFMSDAKKKVIMSLDLSTEEFKEIPQPIDEEYNRHEDHRCLVNRDCDIYSLGVLEDCLCIYSPYSQCSKKWIMKNNQWVRYSYDYYYCENKYDVAHRVLGSTKTLYSYDDDGERVPIDGNYIRDSIFVKSLVSPHPHINNNNNNDYEGQNRNVMQGQEAKEGV